MASAPDVVAHTVSRFGKVRLRMGKFIRTELKAPAVDVRSAPREDASAAQHALPDVTALAQDLAVLDGVVDDCSRLIAEAWKVAVILNRVRRSCPHCDDAGLLAEALGVHQGILNEWQHLQRTAAGTLMKLRMVVLRADGVMRHE